MYVRSLLLVLLVSAGVSLPGQETAEQATPKNFGIFVDDNVIDVTLKFDVTTYLRKKPKDEFLKAEMTMSRNGDTLKRDIRLKTRGKFRNTYCALAPIELNFKKVEFGYADLDSLKKVKLVAQCSWGTSEEEYVFKEYLVYKMYSVLTDTSYRVQLLRLTYLDSEKDRKPITQYGFFIEPDEMLGKRINAIELKATNLNQKHIIPVVMDRIALFNYMIGNYDWSVPGQHNITIFKRLSPSQLALAVPYDFDWTGFVNAPYAIPAENVGTDNVKERLFLGVCRQENVFRSELNDFEKHKADFYKVINDFALLKPREKTEVIKYLDQFFDDLKGNRNNLIYTLRNSCKNF
jgi:hypothetical protein